MSFQVFQAQGLRIYTGDTATVNQYVGLAGELAITTDNKSIRILDGMNPGGTPLTTANGTELQGLNIEQLANLLVSAPQDGQALVYEGGKWKNKAVAASGSGGASHVNDLVDVKLTNLQTGEVLSYNASILKWENKPVAAADHNHDSKYQLKGNYLRDTSNLGEVNDVQITMPADGQSLVYDAGYQKWINTTLAEVAGGSGGGTVISETSPIGMIAPFAMENAPDEWLVCDGSTLNSVANPEYADLFTAIGTTWGGTGASDFKVPDIRGEFLRGLDSGRSIDAGRAIGTSQEHGIPKLEGSVASEYNAMYGSSGIFKMVSGDNQYGSFGGSGGKGFEFSSTDVIPDSPEVRPRNVAVLYCIKYKAVSGSAVEVSKEGQLYRTCGYRSQGSTVNFTLDKKSKFTVSVNGRYEGGSYHPSVSQFVINSADGTITSKTDAWGDAINESYDPSTGVLSIHFDAMTSSQKVDVFYGDLVVN